MTQSDSVIFGKKEVFAIEIKQWKEQAFYMRLWFEHHPIGTFGKWGGLNYIIKEYFRLLSGYEAMYSDQFDGKSDQQIFQAIFEKLFLIEEGKKWNFDPMFFGVIFGVEQFLQYSIFLIFLAKERKFKVLIYEMTAKEPPQLYSYYVRLETFFEVYKEFMRYVYENNLNGGRRFFPEGYSEADIYS